MIFPLKPHLQVIFHGYAQKKTEGKKTTFVHNISRELLEIYDTLMSIDVTFFVLLCSTKLQGGGPKRLLMLVNVYLQFH